MHIRNCKHIVNADHGGDFPLADHMTKLRNGKHIVNADHGGDFPLADHMTKLRNGKHIVNADHGGDFPLADHMTKLRNFTKGLKEFSAFPFSLQLMLDQTFSNVIV